MSQQQGPIIVVSDDKQPALMAVLGEAMFPVIETNWAQAARAVVQLHPAIVLAVASEGTGSALHALARQIGDVRPYLPLLAIDPKVHCRKTRFRFRGRTATGTACSRVCARRFGSEPCTPRSCAD